MHENFKLLIRVSEYCLCIEQDKLWLELVNKSYTGKWWSHELSEEMFEWLIDQFERASKFQHHKQQPLIRTSKYKLEILTGREKKRACNNEVFCCICGDGEGSFCNNILFCELCNIAVHQVLQQFKSIEIFSKRSIFILNIHLF